MDDTIKVLIIIYVIFDIIVIFATCMFMAFIIFAGLGFILFLGAGIIEITGFLFMESIKGCYAIIKSPATANNNAELGNAIY